MSNGMSKIAMTAGLRILVIVLAALAAYLVEVGLYAFAFAVGERVFSLGDFGGLAVAGRSTIITSK